VGVFFRQAARYGDRALVHFQSGDQWKVHSWNDAQRNVLAVASGLIDAGVRAGDSVILISENRVEWICCDWAIQSIGAITVPIYPNSPEEKEIRFKWKDILGENPPEASFNRESYFRLDLVQCHEFIEEVFYSIEDRIRTRARKRAVAILERRGAIPHLPSH